MRTSPAKRRQVMALAIVPQTLVVHAHLEQTRIMALVKWCITLQRCVGNMDLLLGREGELEATKTRGQVRRGHTGIDGRVNNDAEAFRKDEGRKRRKR